MHDYTPPLEPAGISIIRSMHPLIDREIAIDSPRVDRVHLSRYSSTRSRQMSHQFLQTIFDPNEILNFVRSERGEASALRVKATRSFAFDVPFDHKRNSHAIFMMKNENSTD